MKNEAISELYRKIKQNLDHNPAYKEGTVARHIILENPPQRCPNLKAQLQREVDVKDYSRRLLIWMGSNPKKRKGISYQELEDAVGLKTKKPKSAVMKEAIKKVLITQEGEKYRIPKKDIISHLIQKHNIQEKKIANVFNRPALTIEYKHEDKS